MKNPKLRHIIKKIIQEQSDCSEFPLYVQSFGLNISQFCHKCEDPNFNDPMCGCCEITPPDDTDDVFPDKPEEPIDLSPDPDPDDDIPYLDPIDSKEKLCDNYPESCCEKCNIGSLSPQDDCHQYCICCPIYGCTNPNANNYNEEATEDDGSCEFPVKPEVSWIKPPKDDVSPVPDEGIVDADEFREGKIGCTDQSAQNFDPQAQVTCNEENYDGDILNDIGKPPCCEYLTDKPEEEQELIPIPLPPYNQQCIWCPNISYISNDPQPNPDGSWDENPAYLQQAVVDNGYWYITPPPENYLNSPDPQFANIWPPEGLNSYPQAMHEGLINQNNCADYTPIPTSLYGQNMGEGMLNAFANVQEYCGEIGFTTPEITGNGGCTWSAATNYDPDAEVEDGSCLFFSSYVFGPNGQDDNDFNPFFETISQLINNGGPCQNGAGTEYGSCLEEYTFMSWLPDWEWLPGDMEGGWESYGTAATSIWGGDCGVDCWAEQLDSQYIENNLGPVTDILNGVCWVTNWLNTTPMVQWGTNEATDTIAEFLSIVSTYLPQIPGIGSWANDVATVTGEGSQYVNNGYILWGDITGDLNYFIDSTLPVGLEWHCEGDEWGGIWDENNDLNELFDFQDWIENPYLQAVESLIIISCWVQDWGCEPFLGLGTENPDGPGGCSTYGCACCADPLWGLCNGTYDWQDLSDYLGMPLELMTSYLEQYEPQPDSENEGQGTFQMDNPAFLFWWCSPGYMPGSNWGLDWPWWQSQQQGSIQATYDYLGCNNPCGLNGPNCGSNEGSCPSGYTCSNNVCTSINELKNTEKPLINESTKARLQKLAGIQKKK